MPTDAMADEQHRDGHVRQLQSCLDAEHVDLPASGMTDQR